MKTLFIDCHVWDGDAGSRFEGELLIAGDRIEAVRRGRGQLPRDGASVVDHYTYFDTRAELGHYLEFMYQTELGKDMFADVPRF